MLLPGKRGQDAARAAPWPAAETSPAQPDGRPESLHLPSRPWPAFQTRPAGFQGAGGVPKHQGSGAKAFPGTGAGRTPCQEQHTLLTSPSQPPNTSKTPGEMLSVGATSGQFMAACQCPRGLCSTHKTHSRGLHAPGHGWSSPYTVVKHPLLPLGHHSWAAKCRRVCFGARCSYVRKRESGGDEPCFIGQKMEVRGS